jgi:hypothetical protein
MTMLIDTVHLFIKMPEEFGIERDPSVSCKCYITVTVLITAPPLGGHQLDHIVTQVRPLLKVMFPLFIRGLQSPIPGCAPQPEKRSAICMIEMIAACFSDDPAVPIDSEGTLIGAAVE